MSLGHFQYVYLYNFELALKLYVYTRTRSIARSNNSIHLQHNMNKRYMAAAHGVRVATRCAACAGYVEVSRREVDITKIMICRQA